MTSELRVEYDAVSGQVNKMASWEKQFDLMKKIKIKPQFPSKFKPEVLTYLIVCGLPEVLRIF